MKCPVCEEKKMKSCVYIGHSMSTLMYCTPYYDEEGLYHHHDSNTSTTTYTCSVGHAWSESQKGSCPSCEFGRDSKVVNIHNSEETNSETNMSESSLTLFKDGESKYVDGVGVVKTNAVIKK